MKIRSVLWSNPARIFSALLGLSSLATATTPQLINFQGIARRSDGSPIANANAKLRFTIHQGSTTGAIAYQELDSVTTSAGGQFAVQIGTGTVQLGALPLVAWESSTFFLQTEIDPTGGSTFADMGTQQMAAVPYALQSHLSDLTTAVAGTQNRIAMFGAGGGSVGDSNIYFNQGLVGIGAQSTQYVLDVQGTVRGLVLRSQGGAVVTGDVSANSGTFASAATVGGFGVLHGMDSSQLKIYYRNASFQVTSLPPGERFREALAMRRLPASPKSCWEASSAAPGITRR